MKEQLPILYLDEEAKFIAKRMGCSLTEATDFVETGRVLHGFAWIKCV